jgi:uncharacterized membrane protein YraQ (UPF0718 family)
MNILVELISKSPLVVGIGVILSIIAGVIITHYFKDNEAIEDKDVKDKPLIVTEKWMRRQTLKVKWEGKIAKVNGKVLTISGDEWLRGYRVIKVQGKLVKVSGETMKWIRANAEFKK